MNKFINFVFLFLSIFQVSVESNQSIDLPFAVHFLLAVDCDKRL